MVAVDLLTMSTATAACFALIASNLANMYQTISLVSSNNRKLDSGIPNRKSIHVIPDDLNTKDTIKYMEKLSRQDLLTLFLASDAPPIEKMQGDWNGRLLDNNNWIMTKTSRFFTHGLFASRRGIKSLLLHNEKNIWDGKSFGDNFIGINRFFTTHDKSSNNQQQQKEQYQNHKFNYKITSSSFFKGNKSLELIYENYQNNPFSLWRSMKDEIRVVKTIRDDNDIDNSNKKSAKTTVLLLGMGCMQWSGGMYNAAPFCLWKSVE